MCITPFVLKERDKITGASVAVPCGKCPECLSKLVSGWSFRLVQEGRKATSALFVTLTYDTDHVPISRNGFMSLRKEDTQNFMKYLRKILGQETNPDQLPVKYFTVGEYGGKTKRPHYHLIIYNATHEAILQAWTKGSVHFGDVSGASIGYTLKYMFKGGWRPMHRNDDRVPQFRLMSKSTWSLLSDSCHEILASS